MVMRDALDKHYADAGKYPAALEELVSKRYLRAIPRRPVHAVGRRPGSPCRPRIPKKGGIYDVRSAAKGYERW